MREQRVKMAVVGLRFGRSIVESLINQTGAKFIELRKICDSNVARLAEVAARTGISACASLDTVLADPDIEAVGLFTGPAGRAELIRKIIRAGKHVMTTKPFEVDPAAAMDVLHEARVLGRAVHLNSPSPLLPADLAQIRSWQKKYELGHPIGCRRAVWANYREKADGNWYDDPAQCPVAPMFRLGIYCINDLVRLFGEAERVSVMSSRIFTGRPTPDNAQLTILFKNQAIATVFASFCVNDGQAYANSMTMNFENGTIYRNVGPLPTGQTNATCQMSVVAKTAVGDRVIENVVVDQSDNGYQWEAFARAVRGEKLADEVTPEEIVGGLRIIAAMARSEKSGAIELVM